MLTLAGRIETKAEDIDLDTAFRRTDEEMDPGLSARIDLGLKRLKEDTAAGHGPRRDGCLELVDADDIPF